MAQAVSHPPGTAEARFRSQTCPWGIRCGLVGTASLFSACPVPLSFYHCSVLIHSLPTLPNLNSLHCH